MREILPHNTIVKAAYALTAGQLVGLPTETVYGLGGDATNAQAVAAIFALKGRPQFNPLIAHVPTLEAAQAQGIFNAHAFKLAQAFWPGPLTLVLPAHPNSTICELARAGLPTIALRVPSHPVALAVLHDFGRPIAAPSANISGRLSPTTATAVRADFGDQLPIVLDGGACTVGLESTIIGFDEHGTPILMRAGFITRTQVEACLGMPIRTHTHSEAPTSPGQLLKHYAPRAPLILNSHLCPHGAAYLGFGAIAHETSANAKTVLNLSNTENLIEAASNLFAHLRALDAHHPTSIHVAPIPHKGLGDAINDRLMRGAFASNL